MLSLSDTNIQDVSSIILNKGYDVAFLVPTQTGINKSILDAHGSLRAFLKRTAIHEYQGQSPGIKRYITAKFITNMGTYEIKVSLYRPKAKGKEGDPRIWIYGLKKLAQPNNLLALIAIDGNLYIVNCSKENDLNIALSGVLPAPIRTIGGAAKELLEKLSYISSKGFIPTVTFGDTGVGMTLESELGIAANSSKDPDYKGIELKCSRVGKNRKKRNKNQLFSKTPNWKISPIKSAENLIIKRGYNDSDGYLALRHTINGVAPNSLGLFLDIDYANDHLLQMFKDLKKTDVNIEHDTTWIMNDLKSALIKKHRETFWVNAEHNNDRAAEKFHYVEVIHTANPFVDKFEALVETGLISLDYTMHIKPNGKVRDHGYLFKLHQNSIGALFPEQKLYDLTTM